MGGGTYSKGKGKALKRAFAKPRGLLAEGFS